MAKVSKRKNVVRGSKSMGGKNSSVKGRNNSVKRRSKTMKKAKKGTKMAEIMKGSDKPRPAYCLVCKKKVMVKSYDLKQMPNGSYQLRGTCPVVSEHKVFTFVSAKNV